MKRPPHNRQLPLSKKAEEAISKEEGKSREKILREVCINRTIARMSAKGSATTIYVSTFTSNQVNAPGAWAVLKPGPNGKPVVDAGYHKSASQYYLQLKSVISTLKNCGDLPRPIVVETTAKPIVDLLESGQVGKWARAEWKKASGDTVAYPELWAELLILLSETGAQLKATPPNHPVMATINAVTKRVVTKGVAG